MSTGQPTPIRYLGLFLGSRSQQNLTTLMKSILSSPPARPPIAYPLASRFSSPYMHLSLRSRSTPPWTIGNRFCLSGFLLAARFLSIHRIVLSIASSILGPTVVVLTTSSSAIMMSEPMQFWMPMESSGRINVFVLSQGDSNSTPSSVMMQSLDRDTIWNPPLSVNMLRGQFMNLWRPPTLSRYSGPGCSEMWQVLASRMRQSRLTICSDVRPFIDPLVPTGMKTGAKTSAWGRWMVVARAWPCCAIISSQRGDSFLSFLRGGGTWGGSMRRRVRNKESDLRAITQDSHQQYIHVYYTVSELLRHAGQCDSLRSFTNQILLSDYIIDGRTIRNNNRQATSILFCTTMNILDDADNLPKIRLRDFNLPKFNNQQINTYKSLPKLYTVSQSLQDSYVYRNLKPDLGSLNEFLQGSLRYRHQASSKKKKHQKPEQTQEKRIRSQLLLRKKAPEDVTLHIYQHILDFKYTQILKSRESTALERKVASKIIMESIFSKQFGEEPDSFFQNSIKKKEWPDIPANIKNFLDKQNPDQPIEMLLDEYVKQDSSREVVSMAASQDNKTKEAESNSRVHREMMDYRRVICYNKDKILQELINIKNKYSLMLSKVNVLTVGSEEAKELDKIIAFRKKENENVQEYEHDEYVRAECRKMKAEYKNPNEDVRFIATSKYFVLRKIPMTAEMFFYLVHSQLAFESLRKVHIQDSGPFTQDVLCVFIELLTKFNLVLQSLSIVWMSLSEKSVNLLKILVSNSNLKVLCLNGVEMNTKMFCTLCLGIGQSTTLTTIEMNNNSIDSRALQSISILARYVNQLEYLDLTRNQLKALDEKTVNILQKMKKKTIIVGKLNTIKDT